MQGKLADGAHNSCHSFVRIRDRNLDPSVWRDKSTNTLMIQSQNRQAVPHRLQDLHAVGIAQAGKEESICTSIQGRHFAPGHCSKEVDLVLKMQGFCALLPRLAHFTVRSEERRVGKECRSRCWREQ